MSRPRGFIERWTPRAETLALLDRVRAVLAEYAEHSEREFIAGLIKQLRKEP